MPPTFVVIIGTAAAAVGAPYRVVLIDADLRRRLGAYGHEKARRFGWDVVASQIAEVYNIIEG